MRRFWNKKGFRTNYALELLLLYLLFIGVGWACCNPNFNEKKNGNIMLILNLLTLLLQVGTAANFAAPYAADYTHRLLWGRCRLPPTAQAQRAGAWTRKLSTQATLKCTTSPTT